MMPARACAQEECILDRELGPLRHSQIQFRSWGCDSLLSLATLNIRHALNNFDYLREVLGRKVAHIVVLQEHGVQAPSRARFRDQAKLLGYDTYWAPGVNGTSQVAILSSVDIVVAELPHFKTSYANRVLFARTRAG